MENLYAVFAIGGVVLLSFVALISGVHFWWPSTGTERRSTRIQSDITLRQNGGSLARKRVSVHDLHATILNQMGRPLSFSSESSGEPQTVGGFA